MKPLRLALSYGAALALGTLLSCVAAVQPAAAQPATKAREVAATPNAAPPPLAASSAFSRHSTQLFIDQAAYANRAEIDEARFITAHSDSEAAKDFAKNMLADHTASLHELEHLASSGGFAVPGGLDKKDRTSMSKLTKKHGDSLSLAYSKDQDKDHRQVIAKFQQAADDPRISPAVREYARQSLPILQDHLRMAQRLVATESKGNRTAG